MHCCLIGAVCLAVCSVLFAMCSLLCALCFVLCAVCSVLSALCSVLCPVCCVLRARQYVSKMIPSSFPNRQNVSKDSRNVSQEPPRRPKCLQGASQAAKMSPWSLTDQQNVSQEPPRQPKCIPGASQTSNEEICLGTWPFGIGFDILGIILGS